ncbi:amino acid permease [Komagataeibacter diospyri]|uniref:Gamma-aminobutyrate permease n=1 Tax=Komagataeibacter diospyri TaxID=1932662 RepID=A0A4P5NTF0_9PROT|nr:amino acid permease [Komagataeibacter diospyri]GCE85048.1 gamma-aminobutyrate permease [Komagataeibacter diospyri]
MTTSTPDRSPVIQGAHRLAGWHVSMISVGGIIGAGLFVGTSATIAASGPAVLLSYLGAGAIVWCVMLVLGDLTLRHDTRGSFISHIGAVLGQSSGFVTGWSYVFLWVVTGGAQAVAGGMIISDLCGIHPLSGSMGLVAVALLLNMLPVRAYGRSEAVLSILKLVALAAFMVLGVAWMVRTPHAGGQIRENLLGHGGFFPLGTWAVPAVIPMIVQTFTGCEIAFVASVDSADPARNIQRAITRLPFIVLLFYLGSVLMIVCLRPWTQIVPGHSPFLLVMRYLDIPFAESVAIGMTLMAVMSCLNSSKYVVSRILRELAGLGCAPALLARATPGGAPVMAVILTTSLEVLIILSAAWSPSHVYTVLLGASGNLILFCYFMASLACLRIDPMWRRTQILAALCIIIMASLFISIPFYPNLRFEGLIALMIVSMIYASGFIFKLKRKRTYRHSNHDALRYDASHLELK